MSRPNEAPQKTRVAMVCPCCGGEVTHQRYGFDMIAVTPHLTWTKWYVCDQCEAALTGTDPAARDAAEQAFAAYLEASDHAPAA
ncbi:hypothetical protein [Thiobacillus denitrificans]|uniref:hypothetical protein n=1 Tax=Thiobacillus denitrificans TaxID=36861 RepID=UPI0012F96178|nr:hypothetical protein [Thiobacillus denitrificans]